MSDPRILNARANKSLGQHFLFDPDILNRTALSAGPVEGRTIIEVGPGPGGLTAALLRNGAKKVIAVEMDSRFAENLRSWKECKEERLSVVEGNGLEINYEKLVEDEDQPVKIIANLPYNVGTPMLINWIKAGAWRGEMGLMFQHEVAARVCAQPGEKHYGRLAVLSQAVANTHIAFTLPPGAFKPPPKVDSSVAVLMPLAEEKKYPFLDTLEQVTGTAFGQRRKMLRASLKSLAKTKGLNAQEWLESCDIDPTRRAETLEQFEFRALTDAFRAG